MEMYEGKLCISKAELSRGIISDDYVRQLVVRKQIRQARRACYGNCALYEVDSLPVQYRAEVYRRWPDLKERAESAPFVDRIEPDGNAMAFYADYVLDDGRNLPGDKQEEYANNCAVLNAFGALLERSNSHRIRQSRRKVRSGEFWAKAAAALPRIGDKWPNSLPQNGRRLQMKWREYCEKGYECMVSRKFRNRNGGKVVTEEQQALMKVLLSHPNNLNNAMVAEYYNATAACHGWEEITASAVAVWRTRFDLVTSVARRGKKNFMNENAMQVRRSRPTAPFLMWTLDGWDVELLYQAVKENKKGHRVTTYTNRLTIVVVLDPCCNYPIGYAIGTHETPALIGEALRNAARHSLELTGTMLRANQIQSDNYAFKSLAELYGVMAGKVTPAAFGNAKSKVVEPYFFYLNEQYCKRFHNWSGYGITSDRKKQPNTEHLYAIRHHIPTEEGVRRQIHEMMRVERQRKVARFLEMYAGLKEEHRLELSKEQYLYYFGAVTGHLNAMTGSGLLPTLLGERRAYDTFDIEFRKHAGERWQVRFDPDDLSQVLAVSADGTRRYLLQEKYVQPMALAERKDGDAEKLEEVFRFNRRLLEHATQDVDMAYEKIGHLVDPRKKDDLLSRLLITDSDGQHKLPKAQRRLADASLREAVEAGEWDLF